MKKVVVVIGLLGFLSLLASGFVEATNAGRDSEQVQVFRLQHAEIEGVRKVLQSVMGISRVVNPKDLDILVLRDQPEMLQSAGELIRAIERLPEEPAQEIRVGNAGSEIIRIFPLRRLSSREADMSERILLEAQSLSTLSKPAALVVRGEADEIECIGKLLEMLDGELGTKPKTVDVGIGARSSGNEEIAAIFPLANAEPSDVDRVLRTVFGLRQAVVIQSRSAVAVRIPRKSLAEIERMVGILDRLSVKTGTVPNAKTPFTEEFGPFDVALKF